MSMNKTFKTQAEARAEMWAFFQRMPKTTMTGYYCADCGRELTVGEIKKCGLKDFQKDDIWCADC